MIERGHGIPPRLDIPALIRETGSPLYRRENISGGEDGEPLQFRELKALLLTDSGIETSTVYNNPFERSQIDFALDLGIQNSPGIEIMAALSTRAINSARRADAKILVAALFSKQVHTNIFQTELIYPKVWIRELGGQAIAEQMAHYFLTLVPNALGKVKSASS